MTPTTHGDNIVAWMWIDNIPKNQFQHIKKGGFDCIIILQSMIEIIK